MSLYIQSSLTKLLVARYEVIEDYVRNCDLCQRRKTTRNPIAPLRDVEHPSYPFKITLMDIIGPYALTPRQNKYLLTFIDHFTKYIKAYTIPEQTAETCAQVYATRIVTWHSTGLKLIIDQERTFMSSFFQEICKILEICRRRSSSYHPKSNGMIDRWHKPLYTRLSHYINSTNTKWDTLVPFYLMAYCTTPNSTMGYSPFYLQHGREMTLPSNDSLRAQFTEENPDHQYQLENLKTSLKLAYKLVNKANRNSHQNNERLYDRKAKLQNFEPEDLVYLYNPTVKPGLTKTFAKMWTGPFKVTKKISKMNYEIRDRSCMKQAVHVN